LALIRIAQAQINTLVGDIRGNSKKIVEAIKRARALGADLVSVPELALPGYPPEDLLLKKGFIRDCGRAIEKIGQETENITAVVGTPVMVGGSIYNAAVVLDGGSVVGNYKKIELPNYGVFDEKRYFAEGYECLFLALKGAIVGITVCEDIWVAGNSVEKCAANRKSDLVLNMSASPFHAGKLMERRQILSRFAKSTGSWVAYTNLVGGQDELVFDGGSLVMDPAGKVIASAQRFDEDMLLVDFAFSKRVDQDVNAEIPGSRTISVNGHIGERNAANPRVRVSPEMGRLEEIHHALVTGTRDYIKKNGFSKVVVGLSGGIDSSLVAAIAVQALGPENVTGVTMPSMYTSDETRSDAEKLADSLDIKLLTVPIKDVFDAYSSALKEAYGEGEAGLEAENLQARIRGNILMGLSNRFGWIVLTTGNKSETAVGYSTLYGDSAGGFAVIKDVPKTVVYELADYINEKTGSELIPASVIRRPPTAELRPGQKDEDSLPPYSVLDPILEAYVEGDKSADEIAEMGNDPEMVREIIRMVDRNEYKRRQAPPGIKITPKAFGRDRRLPLTNRYVS